jgi:hypothetical protein
VPGIHDIAEGARRELMLCSFALDEAAGLLAGIKRDLFEVRRTLVKPALHWKLFLARRHRDAAKKRLDALHAALHDRAGLGVHNADLWSAITRAVDALALSRWLTAESLAREDLAPARTTVHILLTDLAELIGLLHELAWPDEMPRTELERS